ncbi:universal stress protein [Streptomyces brasiliensis]|uniref:Universal stress protein n=1 Tax=Streptomyces brasiliensis TaxID=1954 RepID=A0A917NJV7_9ACTN|nr:universal stress protein [Streptomyces brasiliensis]GGJ06600.1 universal stress protein [Streptomyces brasiliensis]
MTDRRVAVGVDGSLISVRALDWAAQEAVRRGAALRVVYAVPDRDEAAPVLDAAAARVRARHPELPLETDAVEGGVVRGLARESGTAALTVVGTRGFGGFTGPLFGSVSLRLAAHAQGPLAVVRGEHPCAGETSGDGVVLLGLNDDTDERTAAYAFGDAERRGAAVRVLRAWVRGRARAVEAAPRASLARLRDLYPAVGLETRTVRNGPAHALLDATREAAVVVIGAHRRPGGLGPRLGPVALTLVHRSHCPVIVVPAP